MKRVIFKLLLFLLLSDTFSQTSVTGINGNRTNLSQQKNNEINRFRAGISYAYRQYNYEDQSYKIKTYSNTFNYIPKIIYELSKRAGNRLDLNLLFKFSNYHISQQIEEAYPNYEHRDNKKSEFNNYKRYTDSLSVLLIPGLKYSFKQEEQYGTPYLKFDTPLSFRNHHCKNEGRTFSSKYNNFRFNIKPAVGYENISRYNSLLSPWNDFKEGFNTEIALNIEIAANGYLFWGNKRTKKIKLKTKFEYAFLNMKYNIMLNPYLSYSRSINFDHDKSSELQIAHLLAVDLDSNSNFELDLRYCLLRQNWSDELCKTLYVKPRLNFYPMSNIELTVLYNFNKCYTLDELKEENSFEIDCKLLIQ